MAATIVSRPNDFSSAYNPVEYLFSSDIAGQSGTFSSVELHKAFNVAMFILSEGTSNPDIILSGGILTITGSELYDGEHVVIESLSWGKIIVESEFLGIDSGGHSYTRLNASMVCDLYIDGSFVVRKSRFPNLNDQFLFDFSKEIQPSIGNDMKPLTLGSDLIQPNSESSSSVYVEYAEVYDTSIGVPTFILDETATPNTLFSDSANAVTIINAIVPHLEWVLGSVKGELKSVDTDLTNFILTALTSQSFRFLTNSPTSIRIGAADSYQLSFIIDNDLGGSFTRQVVAFSATGSTLATTNTAITITGDSVMDMAVGTRDLSLSILPSGTARYRVDILESAGNRVESFTFNVNSKCYSAQTRFVWLNPRGGYDAYTFNSPRKLNSSVSKGTYSNARVHPVVISDRQESITSVIAKDSITTSTDKVDKETAEWLQGLLESPQVFIELPEGNALHGDRIPVTLINKTRSICDSYNGMFNVSLRYKFAFEKNALRAY